MMLGLSMRFDCDHPDCRETGIVPMPDRNLYASDVIYAVALQQAILDDGWFWGQRGMHCHKHKPRDWDNTSTLIPSPVDTKEIVG